jgi:hypothetical protein
MHLISVFNEMSMSGTHSCTLSPNWLLHFFLPKVGAKVKLTLKKITFVTSETSANFIEENRDINVDKNNEALQKGKD